MAAVRALSIADLSYRMEQFANGGLARVLTGLHPEMALNRDTLQVDKPHHCSQRFDLSGSSILLLPCAFIWPTLMVECCGVDQPTVSYPPRGMAELWQEPSAEQPDPLSALVGRTRAILLATLGLPRTTTQLAGQLGLSPPAVSQHLKVLKDTALVTGRRRGRMVLYQRTPAATTLLKAIQTSGITPPSPNDQAVSTSWPGGPPCSQLSASSAWRCSASSSSLDDAQTFVWLRRFNSQEERQRKWEEFYGSDLWKNTLGPRANPLMYDTSNVIAVEPTPGSAIQ
jgi:DNA-binding transcriptional ArsR family regulator